MGVRYLNPIEQMDITVPNGTTRKLVKFPELFTIGSINKNKIIYAPLLNRLYFLSQKSFKDLTNGNMTEDLVENKLFAPVGVEEDIKPRYVPLLGERSVLNILLTNSCNLRCKYCFAKGGEKEDVIDFDFVKSGIDYLITPKTKTIALFFSGGEPTLALGLIKKSLKYAKVKIGDVTPAIQTNGMVNENTLVWLLKNKIEIKLSCDGPPEIQNSQRPAVNKEKTNKPVEKTIKFLIKNNYYPSVRATITQFSVKRQLEILEYFKDLGIKNISFYPVTLVGRALKKESAYSQSPTLDSFLENLLKTVEIAEEYGINLFSGYLAYSLRYASSCGNPAMYLTPDGFVTTCYEVVSGKEGPDLFVYGKYHKKSNRIIFEKNKMDYFERRTLENLPMCKSCFVRWGCAGDCFIRAFKETGNVFKPNKNRCKKVRKYTREYLIYKVKKHFVQIKPYISSKDSKLYYSMFFNELKLDETKNNQKLKENPILDIDIERADFKKLARDIINYKKSKKYEPVIFLLSFSLGPEYLKSESGKKIISFLNELNAEKIWFRIVKPLPKCVFGKKYTELVKKFRFSESCRECLKLFEVKKGKSLIFCSGKKGRKKIDRYEDRDEIFEEFRSKCSPMIIDKCASCVYKIRKQCNGLCFKISK
jgi:uncharacterized protein